MKKDRLLRSAHPPRCLLAFVMLATCLSARAEPVILKFLTWSEYTDPVAVAAFEKKFNARIQFRYFESDEARDQELAVRDGDGFDLIMVNDIQLQEYASRGWLHRLDEQDIPNRRHLEKRWSRAFPAAKDYGVIYFWGTLGIAYRSDFFPEGLGSWRDLLEPPEELRGKILMPSFARELVGFALKAQGASINTVDAGELNAAGRMLQQQKPFVPVYGYSNLDRTSVLVSGDIWAAPMYNGDVLKLQAYTDSLRYVMPAEGGMLWADYLTISSRSRHKALASQFINFLNRPQIAARQAEFVNYATPHTPAKALLDEAFLNNPVIYPSASEIERSEFLQTLPARAQRKINGIGAELLLAP